MSSRPRGPRLPPGLRLPRASEGQRWRLAAVGVFVAAGALFVTSAIDAGGLDLRASSVSELSTVVRQERARTDGVQQRVEELSAEVDRLGQGVGDSEVRRLRAEVEELRQPAGFTAVRGPGVTVTLDDAPDEEFDQAEADGIPDDRLVVHQQDIQAVANALWLAGAEAMTLQDQRVVSTTGIKCVGNTVVLHGVPFAPPYVITAIGNQEDLLAALEDSDYIAGYRTYVEAYGLGYDVALEDQVELPAFTGTAELAHARVVRPDDDTRADG